MDTTTIAVLVRGGAGRTSGLPLVGATIKAMNKGFILLFASIFSLIGSYIPVLLGESFIGGWSILGGLVGGLFGIWLAVWISKRYGY